jgi:uncharacterized membrane protein YgdD (TMEM256/DUF423 family)
MERLWILCGAVAGLTAVAAAAAIAHAWSPVRPDPTALQQAQSALLMHVLHTPALLAVAFLAARGRVVNLAGAAFALGLLLFCGAVYAQAGFSIRLPHVAPLGGLLLLAGWVLLALAGLGARKPAKRR